MLKSSRLKPFLEAKERGENGILLINAAAEALAVAMERVFGNPTLIKIDRKNEIVLIRTEIDDRPAQPKRGQLV